MTFIMPQAMESRFTCPHCGAISQMHWEVRRLDFSQHAHIKENPLRTARCTHCDKFSIWLMEAMLYPDRGSAPPPNPEMPDNVLELYEEAAKISPKSPRGAAALLRLAIQVLCKELGEPGHNINEDIKSLVRKGLPEKIQKALDVVRVIGNNAVHPGQIDVDNEETVGHLFTLINVIVEYMISLPGRIDNLYEDLPEGSRNAITRRDGSE